MAGGMLNEEDFERALRTLIMNELKSVLKPFRRSLQGRKDDLVDRVRECWQNLRESSSPHLQEFETLLVAGQRVPPDIRERVNGAHRGASSTTMMGQHLVQSLGAAMAAPSSASLPSFGGPAMASALANALSFTRSFPGVGGSTMGQGHGLHLGGAGPVPLPPTASSAPAPGHGSVIMAHLQHPKLPFLMALDALSHVESVLDGPFELAATAHRLVHRFLITDGAMLRVKREGLRVQLRCQRADTTVPATCWPMQVDAIINSLPVRIKSTRLKYTDPPKPSEIPLDVTDRVGRGYNMLLLSCAPEPAAFVMCVVLVRRLQVSALRDSVVAAPASRDLTYDQALAKVKGFMAPSGGGSRGGATGSAGDDDDDEDVMIVSSTLTVSLRDPISLSRITVPARGKHCRHVTCFDLDTILEFAGSSAGAGIKCPICHKTSMLPELYVDPFMRKLLQDVPESVTSVELDASGQWHMPQPKSAAKDATRLSQPATSSDQVASVAMAGGPETHEAAAAGSAALPAAAAAGAMAELLDMDSDHERDTDPPDPVAAASTTGPAAPASTGSAPVTASVAGSPSISGSVGAPAPRILAPAAAASAAPRAARDARLGAAAPTEASLAASNGTPGGAPAFIDLVSDTESDEASTDEEDDGGDDSTTDDDEESTHSRSEDIDDASDDAFVQRYTRHPLYALQAGRLGTSTSAGFSPAATSAATSTSRPGLAVTTSSLATVPMPTLPAPSISTVSRRRARASVPGLSDPAAGNPSQRRAVQSVATSQGMLSVQRPSQPTGASAPFAGLTTANIMSMFPRRDSGDPSLPPLANLDMLTALPDLHAFDNPIPTFPALGMGTGAAPSVSAGAAATMPVPTATSASLLLAHSNTSSLTTDSTNSDISDPSARLVNIPTHAPGLGTPTAASAIITSQQLPQASVPAASAPLNMLSTSVPRLSTTQSLPSHIFTSVMPYHSALLQFLQSQALTMSMPLPTSVPSQTAAVTAVSSSPFGTGPSTAYSHSLVSSLPVAAGQFSSGIAGFQALPRSEGITSAPQSQTIFSQLTQASADGVAAHTHAHTPTLMPAAAAPVSTPTVVQSSAKSSLPDMHASLQGAPSVARTPQ